VFTYFGLLETIVNLLQYNPTYAEVRASAAARKKVVGCYRSSPDYNRLNTAAGGQLDDAKNSTYEIGYDDGAIFNVTPHSTGFIVLRYVPVYAELCCISSNNYYSDCHTGIPILRVGCY
jgi:hypothetical protein